MFTSSTTYQGNLFGAGGISTPDAYCTSLGQNNIPGKAGSKWVALLWIDGVSPFARLRSPPDGWYSVPLKTEQADHLLFRNVSEMMDKPAPGALHVSEKGEEIDSPQRVWTGGGKTQGTANCNNWKSASGDDGVYGAPLGGQQWMNAGTVSCDASGRLYCVEQ